MAKIVVTFGRFNPPTAGHHLLAKTVMDRATDLGADHMIYGSMSTDPKKNPLTADQKAKHMSRVLGTSNVHVGEGARNPFEMLKHLSDRGYRDVHVVLGSDRADEGIFKKMQEYVSAGELPGLGKLGIKTLTSSTAGEARSDTAKGLAGVSGTKQRAFVTAGDFKGFRAGLPPHVSEEHARELFDDVKRGMVVSKPAKKVAKKKVTKKKVTKKKLKEEYSGPLSFVINYLLTEAEKKTTVERKTSQNSRKRQQRADDKAKQASGDLSQYMIVSDKNDRIEIITKGAFRSNIHTIEVEPKKMTSGALQNAVKDPKFRQTPTSIKLVGKIEKETSGKKQGSKKETAKKSKEKEAPLPVPVKVPRISKGSKSSYPDDDHQAVDMEVGVVAAFNMGLGLDIDKQVKLNLITPQAAQFLKTSQTLLAAGQRAVSVIQEQLATFHPGSNFVARHYGSTKAEKISKLWASLGGVDNTPKSDILFQDRNTGQVVGISVKCGPSQLMSGKAGGEATATIHAALQTIDRRKLSPAVKSQVKGLIKSLKNLVNEPQRTKGGDISDFLPGGELEGKDTDITKYDDLHKKAKRKLADLLSESKEFREAFVFEALSGAAKFDTGNPEKVSPSVAQYVLAFNKDGTNTSLSQITPEYANKVADALSFNIRFKSSSVKSKDALKIQKKTGRKVYSYWSVIAMVLDPKKMVKESFTHNTLLRFLSENFSNVNLDPILDQVEAQVGGEIYSLMEFLEVEPETADTSDIDLSEIGKQESGFFNIIKIGNKEFEIPVEKNMQTEPLMENPYVAFAKRFLLEKRDYRKEYDNYQGKPDQVRNRSNRNKARRLLAKMGRVRKGDGKDVDHKNGNPKDNSVGNLRVTSKSHNRSKR
jgi:hypothetical protein